jgi:hypothetical protein
MYNLILTNHTYVPSKKTVVTQKLCDFGIHERLKKFIKEEVGLPWDEGNKLLQEHIGDIGIPIGYIIEDGGQLEFIRSLPSTEHYVKLVDLFAELYGEQFCEIEIMSAKKMKTTQNQNNERI